MTKEVLHSLTLANRVNFKSQSTTYVAVFMGDVYMLAASFTAASGTLVLGALRHVIGTCEQCASTSEL